MITFVTQQIITLRKNPKGDTKEEKQIDAEKLQQIRDKIGDKQLTIMAIKNAPTDNDLHPQILTVLHNVDLSGYYFELVK